MGELGGVTARLALSGLGDVVRQLGQGLGRADANATGDPRPGQDARAHGAGTVYQVALDALQPDEGLIDRVDLLVRPQACGQAHHPIAHVPVELKVRRQADQPGFIFEVADLVPRVAHADAQVLGLVRAGNRAAIVVGQHDHWSS